MIKRTIRHRTLSLEQADKLELSSYPNKLQQILGVRCIQSELDLDYRLSGIIPPDQLLNSENAGKIIFDAIQSNHSILIVGDFDADGATSSALMLKALNMLGANNIQFLVPDRFQFGYGLSEKLVEHAATLKPDLIITVDNGIANHQGVDKANELGIPVIITDHHLAAETLPNALVIVNPNQPDDNFESKNLAGVGVAFYLMLTLRRVMREAGWFELKNIGEPNFAELLDLVALGTVADVVVLDKNNRILVEQGLKRIRSGKACFGINALLEVANRSYHKCQASDLGFAIGPRLNAAGRLQDMTIGINCLLAKSQAEANQIARHLDSLNKQRRTIEQEMLEQANADLAAYFSQNNQLETEAERPTTLCLYDPQWHQGVIGILASRVKDKINRPVIVFARDEEKIEPMIKGSARSVAGVHIRDVLVLVDNRYPNLIEKFGGHAMAAGLSLKEKDFKSFAEAFHQSTEELLGINSISDEILTDGHLNEADMNLDFAQRLKNIGPWGQGFPEPLFDDEFIIISQRVVGEKHLKLVLKKSNQLIDAIHFFFDENLKVQIDDKIRAVYKLDINEYRGNQTVQLIVEQIEIA